MLDYICDKIYTYLGIISVKRNKSSSLTVIVGCGLSLTTQGHSEISLESGRVKVLPSKTVFSEVINVSDVT